MREDTVNKALAVAIFIILIVILATPFLIRKSPSAFTQIPRLRFDYIDNRTVYDVQSELGDYPFERIIASITWINDTGINGNSTLIKNAYVLTGETVLNTFNLTIQVSDSTGTGYRYMGDVNITKFIFKNRFYVFMNITEHSDAWKSRKSSVELSNMPYKTTLEQINNGLLLATEGPAQIASREGRQ